ncbi:MAG: peptide ABC transporter ATP-binding protein [Candidatus Thermofonsia Clade 1 bacterium]|jgi:oligopeptide transport system ATP-binding protein|uniref:Peptide ABC transporter ATP-binding protein n=1 Tax=Candidatus Thermofonsia Clade 1 bacterium TaxID=2364210 RepID=A0A2M8PGG2_9CHLR|nr:MAG: peptide ABC transporter ATP-binding protein [Candidatus Thermofonsia Clade 1 bacterium]RMF49442.1 MAG: ABC transporter ATP-binding protein [Chloroflexota bacterium]
MEVKDLRTYFHTQEGTVYAVNGISYTVDEGETLGIVGESGSGKSVQSLSILGLIPSPPGKIESGSVIFRGRDLLKLSREEMRAVRGAEIAMIFQDPMTSLNPVLTIGRQITEALQLHLAMDKQAARRRAIELLQMVGIPGAERRLDDYPHQFSGGMRQRAMIAMALSCNPQLLIADEPTTALDVTIQAQIIDLVRRLRDEIGMAMIWITHDLGVIAGLADTIQVMYAGFIVERGPVMEIFSDTRHPYTLGLRNSLPRVDQRGERLIPIEGSPPDMRKKPKGCPFAPRCIYKAAYKLTKCEEENPPLMPVEGGSPNHLVACWVDVRKGVPAND